MQEVTSVTDVSHEPHLMLQQAVDESGTQEWLCPTCGRHLLLSFPPNYRKIVLDVGDLSTPHVGGAGGISMTAAVTPTEARPRWTDEDDRALEEWQQAMGG